MTGVAWGVDYEADAHAVAALREAPRPGPPALHDDTPALVERVADALLQLPFRTWDFGDSVAFEALVHASERLGSDRWESFAHGWGRAWATRSRPFARLDCTAPGRALTLLAERHDDGLLLNALVDLVAFLRSRPTLSGLYETWDASPLLNPYGDSAMTPRDRALLADPPGGVFVDCLHFDPPFFAALGRVTRDRGLVADAVAQTLGYVDLLQRPDGLFDHFALRGESHTFGPGWGRGQGWAALGLLEVITELDEIDDRRYDTHRRALAASADRLLTRMAELQRTDGHWDVVVDVPGSGDEYSTAAFMAWAMAEALGMEIGDAACLEPASRAARDAIVRSLDAAGQLREVSAAVYASTVPAHYAAVPRGYVVPWGQGPALLALLSKEVGS
jgi:unsaturated rhamnogalacturonyl hydrolase